MATNGNDKSDKGVEMSSMKEKVTNKRELQFAIESQQEIGESLSRLRTRKRVVESYVDKGDRNEDDRVRGSGSRRSKTQNDGVPNKLKELLQTRLLENTDVWYIRGHKSTNRLAGTIKGTGILCFCDDCQGSRIISPNKFEIHAGSANKRPADYIYLDNQSSLRDILNACKHTTLDGLETTIRTAISSAPAPPQSQTSISTTLQAPICGTSATRETTHYDFVADLIAPHMPHDQEMNATIPLGQETNDTMEIINESNESVILEQCTNQKKDNSSSTSKTEGKTTTKDVRLHKLVFNNNILPDGTKLAYYLHEEKRLSGYKQGSGIYCECCNAVVSPSQFEVHAGCASRRKPYDHIFTSDGMSLHEISVKISTEYGVSREERDAICSVCKNVEGNVISCDRCPRVYHFPCAALEEEPQGKWYCRLCDENFQVERLTAQHPYLLGLGRDRRTNPTKRNQRLQLGLKKL